MCGIAGFLGSDEADARAGTLEGIADRMARTLTSRGPDDEGVWVDEDARAGFGHRRLSIVDLSERGHQPMQSSCQRYVISYNGEIYNCADLTTELEARGHAFRGHSDTEVMLGAFSEWGLAAIERFDGMFAFGLWDRAERVLHLVRDRVGEKPLYYGWLGKTFAFASELKALRAHPHFGNDVDRKSIALYLRYGYVPTPYSIYRAIYKLPPGCVLSVPQSCAGARQPFSPFPQSSASPERSSPVRYWSVSAVIDRGMRSPFSGSEREAADQLELLLRNSVRRRMIADVPVGIMLSGGVDSSSVAAFAQQESGTPVRTFAIGFNERGFDEAEHAKKVARRLGTTHTELYVNSSDALGVIDRLPAFYDEPFADSSQIPTYLLCAMIRQHVTVALSGDGGDELFGGYNRYLAGTSIWRRRLPGPLRALLVRAFRARSPQGWDRLACKLAFLSPFGAQGAVGDKFHKAADVFASRDADDLYHRLVSVWKRPEEVVRGGTEGCLPPLHAPEAIAKDDIAARMMFYDLMTYLPDDILAKVDRASMATSLEVRVPFLDHRIIEFAWQLPTTMKIRGHETKRVLRRVLYRHVSPELMRRPKMGFAVPLAEWLRGPLRDWAEALLDERRLRDDGLMDPGPIRALWAEHLSGRRNWHSQLWCVLMFQAWHEQQVAAAPLNRAQ